jgi:tetratricopeptide (TPR) repeat protein
MEKKSLGHILFGTWIFIMVISSFSMSATAGDWRELERLDQAGLTNRIKEFQERLKKDPEDYETIKGLGIAYYILARGDAEKFGHLAVETLTRVCDMDSRDYEALCYLGSSTTMMARTTLNPVKKMSYTNKGIALMDKAVRRDPDSISVRLTRAYNSKNLPKFLDREGIALEDFEYLAKIIEKDPVSFKSIEKEVYSNLADLYEKRGERASAKEYREKTEEL